MGEPPQDSSAWTPEGVLDHSQGDLAYLEVQQQLQQLSACIPGMIYQYVRHPNGQISAPYVSPSCYDLFGLTSEQIQSDPQRLIELIHPEDQSAFAASIQCSAADLSPWQWTGRFVLGADDIKWVQGASRPRQLPNGDILWDGVLMDVTQAKQTELALRRQTRHQQALAQIQQLALEQPDLNRFMMEVLQILQQVLEVDQVLIYEARFGELRLRWPQEPIQICTPEQQMALAHAVLTAGYPQVSVDPVTPDHGGLGLPIRVEEMTYGVLNLHRCQAPELTSDEQQLVLAVVDILATTLRRHQIEQDRKQTKAQLQTSEERFRSLSTCSPVGIFIATQQGECVWSNPRLHQICGSTFEGMLGSGWSRSVHPEDRERVMAEWKTATDAGVGVDHEYRMQPASGVYRWVHVRSAPLLNDRGEQTGQVGTVEDITEQRQSLDRLRQQTQQQILLNDILQSIRSSLDWSTLLEHTTRSLRSAYGVSRCFWLTCDFEMHFLYPAAMQTAPGIPSLGYKPVPIINNPHAQAVLAQRDPLGVDDIETSPLIAPMLEFTRSRQVQAILAVTICGEQDPIGMLVLEQCDRPRQWTPEEHQLLRQIADQLSVATQQAILYQHIQTLNTNLEHQVEERTSQLQQALTAEATLKRILSKVRDSLDEDQILQTAVNELGWGLPGVESCNLALYTPDLTQAQIRYEYPPDHPYSSLGGTFDLSMNSEIYSQLMQGKTIQYSRLPQNNVWIHKYKRTQLAVPIQDSTNLLGDLWLIRPEGQWFTEAEISLVEQVAAQCAIAIRQARLYQAAQAQVEELAKLNQLKDDFLSTVSHELRSPLTNMRMAIKMLQIAPSDEKRQQYLAMLEQDCRREKELIDDLLSLQRLEANRFDFLWEEIDLNALILELHSSFAIRAETDQIGFQLTLPPTPCQIRSDRSCLERILQELLNNACKYTQPQGQIQLRLEPLPDQIQFSVGNTATLPPEEIPKIFDKFYRSASTNLRRQTGTGLGLSLIKKLVEQMQGQIQVTSQRGWTQFTILFPADGSQLDKALEDLEQQVL